MTDDKERGLFKKFHVTRVDGSSAPGQKHENCEYVVFDMNHDGFARHALRAYARACADEFPALAADLIKRYGLDQHEAAPAERSTDYSEGYDDGLNAGREILEDMRAKVERLEARLTVAQPEPEVAGERAAPDVPEKRDATDPEQQWREFWREICTNADGSINLDQVKKELSDFSMLLSWVPRVYMHVTGGRVSKVNTWPSVVVSLHDDHVNELVEEALRDEIESHASSPVAAFSKDVIREVFMAHGFTIKEGQPDLKPYVYEAAYALLARFSSPNAADGSDIDACIEALVDAGSLIGERFRARTQLDIAIEREVSRRTSVPIDMILHCPTCNTQHVDEAKGEWTNPPHKSHLCHVCHNIWRPADVPTNGVPAIKTIGQNDTVDNRMEF
ncbi:hypothetical protein BcepF1.044 [Burkholderia phage BcepF1]|uniref:Uncharacterized protein n=1 Tax=Burkholderia phage BcepF1 TaxID=2886897 RepID=A1YZU8_9CAUD|nr:sulfatase-modifying factor enzyme [Burkholderia phage BcepF1]ABL96775.1 hypothetical protein BcepF1.044 [Burkholderia phage BcepF1]